MLSPARATWTPRVFAAVLTLTFGTTALPSQAKSDSLLTVARYLDFEGVGDPRLSPDGTQIIYTRRWVNRVEDRWETALWIMSADGSRNRYLTKGSGAVWSPDGTRIAYLAEGEPKGTQIFVRWMDAEGGTSQVTRLGEGPSDVRWSPDGKWLGFSAVVPKTSSWKIDMPEAPKGAKWTGSPRIVQSLHFRQDRRGFMEPGFRHLFVVPADGGTPRQLTTGDWSVGARFDGLDGSVGWDWTPDGRTIVVDGLADSTWDANYRGSNIYAVTVATGVMRRLTSKDGSWTTPAVSPDGRRIAFTGDTALKDSYHASELFVMDIDGGGARKISADLDRDAGDLEWAADGSGVYFTAGDRGNSNLYFAPLTGGVRALTSGDQMLTGVSIRRGTAAAVRSSYRSPPDVVRLTLPRGGRGMAEVTQLTRVNEDVLAGVKLGEVERIRYASTGGAQVDGWIVKPPGFDPSRRYPLLMEIHGGPHGMYTSGFSYAFRTSPPTATSCSTRIPAGARDTGARSGTRSCGATRGWTTMT